MTTECVLIKFVLHEIMCWNRWKLHKILYYEILSYLGNGSLREMDISLAFLKEFLCSRASFGEINYMQQLLG